MASKAASRKTGGPLINCILETLPFLSTNASTTRVPLSLRCLAMIGYVGDTLLITWTGSSSDWVNMEGLEAPVLARADSAPDPVAPPKVSAGAASWLESAAEVAILEGAVESATVSVSGARLSGAFFSGTLLFTEFFSDLFEFSEELSAGPLDAGTLVDATTDAGCGLAAAVDAGDAGCVVCGFGVVWACCTAGGADGRGGRAVYFRRLFELPACG